MPGDVEKPDFNTQLLMFSISSLTLRACSLIIFRDYFKIFYQHFMYLCRRISGMSVGRRETISGDTGSIPCCCFEER